jgi:hypothetical protein
MSDLKNEAVALAEDGFWVFPCRPGTKIPAVRGFLNKKMTPKEVAEAWDRNPQYNIGMCPETNGLVVLDLDLYKSECNWDRKDVPPTMSVRSARGGVHHYFEDSGNRFPGKFNGYDGVDIKHRGVVVLPPSKFADGVYSWSNDAPPAQLPTWMPTRVAVTIDPMAAALLTAGRGSDGGKLIEVVKAAQNTIADRDVWLSIGLGLHFEYADTPHEDVARDAWIQWCRRWGGEDDPDLLEVEAIKVWDHAASPAEVMASGRKPATGGTVMHHLRPKAEPAELAPISAGKLFRRPSEISEDMPPWLVENLIRVGGTQAVVGMSAVGKTALSAGFIAGMLAGTTEVYGLGRVARPLNVAWANAEEAAAAMKLQVMAAQHKHTLPQRGDLLIVGEEALESEHNGLEIVLEQQNPLHGRLEVVPNEPLIKRLIEELKGAKIDLLMVDPITEFNGGDENSRFHARLLNRQFRRISRETGVAVMYWAHTGKPPENKRPDWYAADLYAQRGSSQNIGAVQGGSTLTPFLPSGSAAEAWDAYNGAKSGERPNVILFNTVKMKMSPTLFRAAYVIETSEMNPDIPVVRHIGYSEAELAVSDEEQAAGAMIRSNQSQALVKALGVGVHSRGVVNKTVAGRDGFPKDLRADRPESRKILQRWMRAQECVVSGSTYSVKVVFGEDTSASFEVHILEVANA